MLKPLNLSNVSFFLCDLQEKFIPILKNSQKLLAVADRMLKAADILEIPIVVTEQYPSGLGKTAEELELSKYKNLSIFEKTQFSMLIPSIRSYLNNNPKIESIILFGIESHVCIYQTVLDLIKDRFDVYLVADCLSSRFQEDSDNAINQMRLFSGVRVGTSESVLFELMKDSKFSKFKEISDLIKNTSERIHMNKSSSKI